MSNIFITDKDAERFNGVIRANIVRESNKDATKLALADFLANRPQESLQPRPISEMPALLYTGKQRIYSVIGKDGMWFFNRVRKSYHTHWHDVTLPEIDPLEDTRKEFEVWAVENCLVTLKNKDGSYKEQRTDGAWKLWLSLKS